MERVDVDVFMCATGYTYTFPFLSPAFGLSAGLSVSPLYGHVLHPEERGRLAFPALQWGHRTLPVL